MTFDEKLTTVKEIGKKAQEDFIIKFQRINNWFTSDYDQLYILSFCMRYFLMHEKGYDEEVDKGGLSFAPHYLEILQALSLSHERIYSARPLWENTERLRDEMKEIGKLFQVGLFNIPDNIQTEKELGAYRIRMDVIGYNVAVRNWAYHHQMKTISEDMAKLISEDFIKIHNTCPLIFIKLLFTLCNEIEKRINQYLSKLRLVFSKEDYISIQEEYERVFEGIAKSSKKNKNHMWEMAGKDLSNLRALLLAHSDLALDKLFSFTVDEMVKYSGNKLNSGEIIYLFDKISYKFGDLKEYKKDYIILENPVHNRPFIHIEKDCYFTSLWTSIPHLSLSMLEYLIQDDDNLRENYNIKRAKYLEDQVEILFKKSFPEAQIFKGNKWDGLDNKKYENDLLVIIDSFALVIEAKSGAVTKSAKRGAPDRLFKTLKELIEEPSEQALRFIDYLKLNKGKLTFMTKNGHKNIIDTEAINYFIPLGVTFYHLGVIGCNLKLLIDGGITNKKIHELAPSISITDLQIIFDVLPTSAQKIHYLQRRRELEMQVTYFGDELDLLGFYLDFGFNIGDKESSGDVALNISLMSKSLDPYFINSSEDKTISKPALKMTTWWRDILTLIENRKPKRWLEFSYILLNMNEEDQKNFEVAFKKLIAQIRNKEVELEHNWISYRNAAKKRQFAIVGYPYKKEHFSERNSMLQKIIDQEFENSPDTKGVVIIGVNIDKEHYPYSVLAGDLYETLFDNHFLSMAVNSK